MKKNLDIINIELIVQAVQMDESDIWMQGDLQILINGEKPYSESDIINVDAFLESLKFDGEYFIFSCNCGIPECSGWKKGINVRHNENNIIWSNGNSNDIWQIEKNRINEDLIGIKSEIFNYKKYFYEKGIEYVGVGLNW